MARAAALVATGLHSAAAGEIGPLLARPIPKSGEMVPAVGLSAAANFDVVDDIGRLATLSAVLDAFAAGGGTVIDTASSYGNAENVIGRLLAEARLRRRMFLATKIVARQVALGPDA